ncbi:MAG: hypothetical protein JWO89_2622 [Verrucomicrobiaceae bacterium]|nr:hypothetical protein [Verrucomicrobiaceae bacterium]
MNTLKLILAATCLTALASCATAKKDDCCSVPKTSDCCKIKSSCCTDAGHKAKK